MSTYSSITARWFRCTSLAVLFPGLALSMALLAGCGVNSNLASVTSTQGSSVHGAVVGGQQPVSGAAIQLYAAGSSGYASAATPLIAAGSVRSDSGGGFSITGAYTCPASDAQVYITATGGSPGVGTNANLALMAALGPCGNLSSSTYININEVTTVASVWALAPFMSGLTNLGTSSSNSAGLANAFADVNTLTNIATGNAPGSTPPAGATVPVAEIYTLADIIAACINSTGGLAGSNTPCGWLFTAATPAGGAAPTDTIAASVNIAQHPASNVASLYSLTSPTAPFQPTLSTQPADFTLAVTFADASINKPSALAADSAGNIWIANAARNTVTELSHTGVPLSGSGYTAGVSNPSALGVAADGTIWITNQGNNTVSRLTASGTAAGSSPYSGVGLNQPTSIAFDSFGNAWIANGGGASVTELNANGGLVANFTPAGVSSPIAIGVNPH